MKLFEAIPLRRIWSTFRRGHRFAVVVVTKDGFRHCRLELDGSLIAGDEGYLFKYTNDKEAAELFKGWLRSKAVEV